MQEMFRPRRERLVHPMAWRAFRRAAKLHALNLKLPANERIQIHTFDNDIAPRKARRFFRQFQFRAQRGKNFPREERNLAFVVFLEIKKAVALDATSRHTFNLRHFNRRMPARRIAVMAEIIVAGREIKVADFHVQNMAFYDRFSTLESPVQSRAISSLMCRRWLAVNGAASGSVGTPCPFV